MPQPTCQRIPAAISAAGDRTDRMNNMSNIVLSHVSPLMLHVVNDVGCRSFLIDSGTNTFAVKIPS